MTLREEVARAEIEAEIALHRAALAAAKRSASMSADVEAIGYLEAEKDGKLPFLSKRRLKMVKARLSAIKDAGYVVVPREPTKASSKAITTILRGMGVRGVNVVEVERIYTAMIEASQGEG